MELRRHAHRTIDGAQRVISGIIEIEYFSHHYYTDGSVAIQSTASLLLSLSLLLSFIVCRTSHSPSRSSFSLYFHIRFSDAIHAAAAITSSAVFFWIKLSSARSCCCCCWLRQGAQLCSIRNKNYNFLAFAFSLHFVRKPLFVFESGNGGERSGEGDRENGKYVRN